MTIFDEKFKKNFKKLKEISKDTKGDVFRKKMKKALEKHHLFNRVNLKM